jgi:hypothetical protein
MDRRALKVRLLKSTNMKINLMFIILFLSIVLINSCDKNNGNDPLPKLVVYKLRSDYTNNVCVGISSDKERITCFPSDKDPCGNPTDKPYKVNRDYYLDALCNYGVNSAYLSVTKTDYQNIWTNLTPDSMMNLILDADPYIEFYIDENRILEKICTDCFTLDTIKLNEIILAGELEIKLKRIK